jgi:hypothetical protein
LIVVRDLPAALNAANTRLDASRTLAISMRITFLIVMNRQGDSSLDYVAATGQRAIPANVKTRAGHITQPFT